MTNRLLTIITTAVVVSWLLLVLLSWLLSAMMVGEVRSLLTGEGLRWLFGHLADGLLSPLLSWLLMAAISWGCLRRSGLFSSSLSDAHVSPPYTSCYRRNTSLRVAVLFTLAYAVVIVLLAVLPHAVLLSPTGTLWHSPFSRALVPLTCFGGFLLGVVYGFVARTFTSLHDIIEAMLAGLRCAAPLLFAYMLLMPLVQTLCYVFF